MRDASYPDLSFMTLNFKSWKTLIFKFQKSSKKFITYMGSVSGT